MIKIPFVICGSQYCDSRTFLFNTRSSKTHSMAPDGLLYSVEEATGFVTASPLIVLSQIRTMQKRPLFDRIMCCHFIRAIVFVLILLASSGCTNSTNSRHSSSKNALLELIADVSKNEELFRNLETVVQKTFKGRQKPPEPKPGVKVDFLVERKVETIHQITQGDRFRVVSTDSVVLYSGRERSVQTVAVFNGEQTIVITDGNCAAVYGGRYEPAFVMPSHVLCMFHEYYTFPLSALLKGETGIESHPKIRGAPADVAWMKKYQSIDVELSGEEILDGMKCIKLRLKYGETNPKGWHFIQELWLAKARNFHVARCQPIHIRDEKDTKDPAARVTEWKEIKPSVWFPYKIEWESIEPDPTDPQDPLWHKTYEIIVSRVVVDPAVPDSTFDLPEVPRGLPLFTFDAEGVLTDAPLFPHTIANAPQITLDEIRDRLLSEESKYGEIEIHSRRTGVDLNPTQVTFDWVGLGQTEESARTIFSNGRFLNHENCHYPTEMGTTDYVKYQIFDGKEYQTGVYKIQENRDLKCLDLQSTDIRASADAAEFEIKYPFRAHSLVFEDRAVHFALSYNFDHPQFIAGEKLQPQLEYVGDDLVGDLHCHKLKWDFDLFTTYLWLARDRNLIPIRR